jgi:hypothetical protein
MHGSSAGQHGSGRTVVLDGQTVVYGVEGTQKNLTDNVNRMTSNLTPGGLRNFQCDDPRCRRK